jgi:hypothetical protein
MGDGDIAVVWDGGPGGAVCAMADGSTSHVAAAALELVAGRAFWVYRAALAGDTSPDAARELLRATFAALDADFTPPAGGPLGLCVLSGREELRADPAARWADPPLVHAGFLPDGRQVRIGYFAEAHIDG